MTNTVRIKRRAAGSAAGAPSSLQNAEIAFNEQDSILYYGVGTGGVGGSATQIIAIAGPGAFTPIAHVGSGDVAHANVVAAGASGFMTGADKTKLDGIAASAAALGSSSGAALGTAAAGVSTTAARSDHIHQLPLLSALGLPTTSVAMNNQRITGLAAPAADNDAATRLYVDSAVQGLDPKQSVRAATTVAGTMATSFANNSVIDSVTLVTGNRILIKNQVAPADNGIYTVNASGAPTRALDMNAWTEVPGAYVFVEEGTDNVDTGFVCTSNNVGTLNTTAITWVPFSGAGQITANGGLTKTGNIVSVGLGVAGVNLATQVTGNLPVGNGGTGVTSYAVGDLLYANSESALSKLASGTTGQVLMTNTGAAPSWSSNYLSNSSDIDGGTF